MDQKRFAPEQIIAKLREAEMEVLKGQGLTAIYSWLPVMISL